jgi:hypothetical protein
MQEPKFAMFADISHSHMEVLTGCNKTETVVSHDNVADGDNHGRAETMEPCIACFRYLFANDLEIRCGLVCTMPKRQAVVIFPEVNYEL